MNFNQSNHARRSHSCGSLSQRIHSQNLENSLFKYCRSGSTGTVFIATDSNKSCQIILIDGYITAASLGNLRGLDAVLELNKVEIKQFYFIKDMQFPLTIYANIECSDSALNEIGFCENELSNRLNQNQSQKAFDPVLLKAV